MHSHAPAAAFLFLLPFSVSAALNATANASRLTIANDHLYASVNKSTGGIDLLSLDGQDLLGSKSYETPTPGGATGSGNSGIGPYLDCYCTPDGAYTPGSIDPRYNLLTGTDATGTPWAGISMSEVYPPTGQLLEQYWFLRDGETGLHTFSRLAYHNATTPFLRNLQEFRTLFRPDTRLWTNLSTNAEQFAPLPYYNPAAPIGGDSGDAVTVQDATWLIPNASDPYVVEESSFFTKYVYNINSLVVCETWLIWAPFRLRYTFSDTWRDHLVHGLFADGTYSDDGSTFGAWLVMNTQDTYFGGPLHSDLMVDGIVYNYIVSTVFSRGDHRTCLLISCCVGRCQTSKSIRHFSSRLQMLTIEATETRPQTSPTGSTGLSGRSTTTSTRVSQVPHSKRCARMPCNTPLHCGTRNSTTTLPATYLIMFHLPGEAHGRATSSFPMVQQDRSRYSHRTV